MLRFFGIVFIALVCIGIGYWGMLLCAVLCLGWILAKPMPRTSANGMCFSDKQRTLINAGRRPLTSIPLVNAVYCANCDLVTNSPHDECSVCGSRSIVGISQIWRVTLSTAETQSPRFKVSFTADVRGIPATGLKECTKLISRLAELGGRVRALHIQVEPAVSSDKTIDDADIAVLKERPSTVVRAA